MLGVVKSIFRATFSRSLDAAGGGRLSKARTVRNLNSDILTTATTIQHRAAYFARNNAHITAAVNALVTNIVGTGIKPSSQHPDPQTREFLHALWSRWIDECDMDGFGDFYALQALMVRQMVETGESFARFVTFGPGDGLELPFQLQMIHPAQVPLETLSALVDNRIRGGVEFDAVGRRIAYHVLPARPDDPLAPLAGLWNPVPIAARDMVHLFNPVEPGQLRGLSWLAPVLLAVHEVDQLQDAALVRAKLANLLCAALVDPEGNAGGLPGDSKGGVLDIGLEPGTIIPLKPGTSLEFFDPKESEHYGAFIKSHLQAIAAGLGVPYELLTGDLSGVNYSSIRAGLVEFRKRLEHWQHNVVVYRLCRPAWDRFIRTAVLSGLIDFRAYEADPAAFHRVEWMPPKSMWVDPLKDVQAEIKAIRAGLKSRTQAVAERGYDVERIDADLAAEREREKRLGILLDSNPGQTTQAGLTPTLLTDESPAPEKTDA
ncbi:phage portal protein [Azospirillum lipoferum]|uniref:Phage portal protein, lambda family n=1 Tax=Azospirillum lipoferum (strain 4B) TaxID=862719 RepID=G7ZE06_AZOL4|nr:phage portal protein [Azospirillum lipoferum]CBS89226.1 Phage portal protein, lambda family [Azospirillum lipoferum 4B]